MAEIFASAPSQEELDFQFNGIGLDEYRALSESEVIDLNNNHERYRLELRKDEDKFWDTYTAIGMFHNFIKWRKYGIPDRNVTFDEYNTYLTDGILQRGNINMENGAFKLPIMKDMSQPQRDAICTMIEYMAYHQEGYKSQPMLDECDLEYEGITIQELLDHKS